MSRLAIAAVATLTVVGGCLGSAVTSGGKKDGGDGGGNVAPADMAIDVKAEFNSKVLPLLTADCGSCHAQAGGSFPPFLVAPAGGAGTVYDTFTAWPNLVGVTPATSEILTQPTHEGPSYADGTTSMIKSHVAVISQWIADYNAAGGSKSNVDGGATVALTAPTLPQMGMLNTVHLDSLGAAFKNMTITYTPSLIGTTEIKLQDVTLNATAAAGVTVTGTVIAFYNSTDLKNTYAIDTDFNQDSVTAYQGGTGLLGTTITPYASGQYIAFSFVTIVPAMGMPDMGGATSMCKDLTDFATFKQDLLGKNGMDLNCNNCHTAGGASNAFNMSGFAMAANDAMSCATMLNYVTIATPDQSDAYLVVSGGKSHQGGQLSAANQMTFLTALTTWLNGEK